MAGCLLHIGKYRKYRATTIWKNLDNTGFCPSHVDRINYGLKQQKDHMCNLPPVDLNTWVHLTYLKKKSQLIWLEDGVEVAVLALDMPSEGDTGPMWIGRMPAGFGVPESSFDNF